MDAGHRLTGGPFRRMLDTGIKGGFVGEIHAEVAPGIFRISLPHPSAMASNVYLVTGEKPVLIDGGHFSAHAVGFLEKALQKLELRLKHIKYIFLTDGSPDRIGALLAGRVSRKVAAHAELVQPLADYNFFGRQHAHAVIRPMYEDTAIGRRFDWADIDRLCNLSYRTAGAVHVNVPVDRTVIYRVGDLRLQAVPLPGTTGTHMGWYMPDRNLFFSGDIGACRGNELPFLNAAMGGNYGQFTRSLTRVWKMKPDLLLPAHGEPVRDGELTLRRLARMAAQDRENLLGLLLAGPRALTTLVDFMTLGRGLSPLRMLERMGTLLTLLEDLVSAGEVEALYEEDRWVYRLAAGSFHPRRTGGA